MKAMVVFILLTLFILQINAQTTLSTLDYPDPHVGGSLTTDDYGYINDSRVGTKNGDVYSEVQWVNYLTKFVILNNAAPVEIKDGTVNLSIWDNNPAAPVANGYFHPARFEDWSYDAVTSPGVWHTVIEYENGADHIIGAVGYKLYDPSPILGFPYIELNPAYQFTNVGTGNAILRTIHYERNVQTGNSVYSNHGGSQWDYDNSDGTSDDFVAVSSAASSEAYFSFAGFPIDQYRIQDSAGNLLNTLQTTGANYDLPNSTAAVLSANVEIAYQFTDVTLAPGEAVIYWLYPKPIKVVNTTSDYPTDIDYEKKNVNSTFVDYAFAETDVSVQYTALSYKTNGALVTATATGATVAEITGGIVASNVSGALNNVSKVRYWEIFYDTRRLSSTADITFTYNPATDGISDESSLTLAYRTDYSQDWTEWGAVALDQDNNTLTANSVNLGDSQWIIASTNSNNPLPVELTSFSANASEHGVILNWTTASESNNYGFDIQRSEDKVNWEKIGFVAGQGTSTTPSSYSYNDKAAAQACYYRLKQIDTDGTFEYSGSIFVKTTLPGAFELDQNYPNPFNPQTTISFALPNAEFISLRVYNVRGEEIALLAEQEFSAGWHTVSFDASQLAAGLYFYRLQAGTFSSIKKMLLQK